MNKQELLNELEDIKNSHNSTNIFGNGVIYGVTIAMQLIEQLDEPEKVVIPKLVAEAFEKAKRDNWFASLLINAMYESSDEVGCWLEIPSNEKLLLKAWLDGYEVEKEKLYQVIIPTRDKKWEFYYLDHDGGIDWTDKAIYADVLTEEFIRSVSDDLWQFAKEVME